jgi:hypothetical protein
MSNYYDTGTDTPPTNDRQTTDKRLTTTKEGEEGKEREQRPRSVASILAETWNDGPGVHLSGDKASDQIQAAIDVGVSAQDIEVAFSVHHAIKGRKIWDVLDPLRAPVKDKDFSDRREASGPRKI